MELTVVLLKPGSELLQEKIMNQIEQGGLKIKQKATLIFDEKKIRLFWPKVKEKWMPELIVLYSRGQVTALLVEGEEAISFCLALKDEIRLKKHIQQPDSLIHASDNPEKARREISIIFPNFKITS